MNMENKYISATDPYESLPDSTSVTYTYTLPTVQTMNVQYNPLFDNTVRLGYSSTLIPIGSGKVLTSSGTTLISSGTIYMDMSTGQLNYTPYEKDYSNLTTLGLIEECLNLIDKL